VREPPREINGMFAAAVLRLYDREMEIPSKGFETAEILRRSAWREEFSKNAEFSRRWTEANFKRTIILQFSSEIHSELHNVSFALNNRSS